MGILAGKINAAAILSRRTVFDAAALHGQVGRRAVQVDTAAVLRCRAGINAAVGIHGQLGTAAVQISTAAICSRAVLDGAAIQVNLCGAVVRGRRIVADPQSTVSAAAVKDAVVQNKIGVVADNDQRFTIKRRCSGEYMMLTVDCGFARDLQRL